jgi:ATP-dependent protease ClpP protease subunit
METIPFKNKENSGRVDVVNNGDSRALEVRVHGVIGESFWEGGINSRDVSDQIDAYGGDVINVSINSPGGSAADGIAIYNMLRRHDATVNVHIDGVAASAASVIAMAGDTISIADSAMVMIHDPMTFNFGNAAEMRETAKVLDKWAGSIAQSYKRHVNKPINEIREMMAAETWLSADEAYELGMAHEIFSDSQPVAAWSFLSNYRNAPVSFMNEVKTMPEKQEVKPVDEVKNEVNTVEETATESPQIVETVVERIVDNSEAVRNELKRFLNAFGPQGAEWFAENLSWDECREKQVENLTAEIEGLKNQNTELNTRVDAAADAVGELSPVSTSEVEEEETTPKRNGFANRLRMPSNN